MAPLQYGQNIPQRGALRRCDDTDFLRECRNRTFPLRSEKAFFFEFLFELLECELSILQLYADQMTLRPMLELLSAAGFELVDLEPGQPAVDDSIAYIDALFAKHRPGDRDAR